jgi:hypothetical protein
MKHATTSLSDIVGCSTVLFSRYPSRPCTSLVRPHEPPVVGIYRGFLSSARNFWTARRALLPYDPP